MYADGDSYDIGTNFRVFVKATVVVHIQIKLLPFIPEFIVPNEDV